MNIKEDLDLMLFSVKIAEGISQILEHNDIEWIMCSEILNYEFSSVDEEIFSRIKYVWHGMKAKEKQRSKKEWPIKTSYLST